MIVTIIIYLLMFVTTMVAIEEIDTTFTLSENTTINTYSNFVLISTPDTIKLYENKLEFKWEINNRNNQFNDFQFEFNMIYARNHEKYLYKIFVGSGIAEKINIPEQVETYQVKYPYLWAKTKSKKIYLYDLRKEHNIWESKTYCDKAMFLSENEITGCLNKKQLLVYNTITGELIYKTKAINNTWDFETLDREGGYFSKGDTIKYLNIKNKQLIDLDYRKNNIKGFVRQKEIMVVDNDNQTLVCMDLFTDKIRWKYTFESLTESIQKYPNSILIKDNNTYKIMNHFSGKILAEFTKDNSLTIKNLYSYNDNYYVFSNQKTYLIAKE